MNCSSLQGVAIVQVITCILKELKTLPHNFFLTYYKSWKGGGVLVPLGQLRCSVPCISIVAQDAYGTAVPGLVLVVIILIVWGLRMLLTTLIVCHPELTLQWWPAARPSQRSLRRRHRNDAVQPPSPSAAEYINSLTQCIFDLVV